MQNLIDLNARLNSKWWYPFLIVAPFAIPWLIAIATLDTGWITFCVPGVAIIGLKAILDFARTGE